MRPQRAQHIADEIAQDHFSVFGRLRPANDSRRNGKNPGFRYEIQRDLLQELRAGLPRVEPVCERVILALLLAVDGGYMPALNED